MTFDHTLRDRDLVVERYLARQLGEDEAAAFEEHYLDCPECQDQLEAVRGLRRGLGTVAAEDAARPLAPWRTLLLAAALVLGALVPAGWFWFESRRLADELVAARAAADEGRTRLEREIDQQRGEIAGLAGDRERIAGLLARERDPQPNTPLVPLAALRSGGDANPTVRVTRPAGAGRLVLGLAVGPDEVGPFGASLRSTGRVIWHGEGLRPDTLGEVRIGFHRESLPPGDYLLILDRPDGRGGGRYAFRVEADPGGDR